MDFNLSDMSVSSVLMVAKNSYLNHESPDWTIMNVFKWDTNPSIRLIKFYHFNLLKVVKVGTGSDGDPAISKKFNTKVTIMKHVMSKKKSSRTLKHVPAWAIAFVNLVVEVNTNIPYGGLSTELNVDQMRQLAIRLPVGVHAVIS